MLSPANSSSSVLGVTMMLAKLFVVLLAVAVPTTLAAPQPKTPIDAIVNLLLNGIPDPFTPNNTLELHLDEEEVMTINLVANVTSITGAGDFKSDGSDLTNSNDTDDSVYIKIQSPLVTVDIRHFTLDGNLVSNIDLVGEGPGWITVEEMVIIIEGTGTINPSVNPDDITAEFTSAKIDLEMLRWTVNLEGIMPGTDLGTVFNEFFTMCGPEIFDTVEKNLNNGGKVLDFLNSLFPPPEAIKGPEA